MHPEINIIIATHKKYELPNDPIYFPLHVGAEGKDLDLGYQKDNSGDNISRKNHAFCELTGLFWAWKNLDSNYIGLVHYRRYFSLRKSRKNPYENILKEKEIMDLIKRYYLILPKKRRYFIETLYSHYAHTHYAEHLDIARKVIAEKYPDYIAGFDFVMQQTYGYMFNMMIMRKDLLNDYCAWLFDILFEMEKYQKEETLSFYQGRFYGRVSEILFNVWLNYQINHQRINKANVKELYCVCTEKINWKRKILLFLQAKVVHKKYEESF